MCVCVCVCVAASRQPSKGKLIGLAMHHMARERPGESCTAAILYTAAAAVCSMPLVYQICVCVCAVYIFLALSHICRLIEQGVNNVRYIRRPESGHAFILLSVSNKPSLWMVHKIEFI